MEGRPLAIIKTVSTAMVFYLQWDLARARAFLSGVNLANHKFAHRYTHVLIAHISGCGFAATATPQLKTCKW
jgi:hypothetical protein